MSSAGETHICTNFPEKARLVCTWFKSMETRTTFMIRFSLAKDNINKLTVHYLKTRYSYVKFTV